jgi:hypothetical protein
VSAQPIVFGTPLVLHVAGAAALIAAAAAMFVLAAAGIRRPNAARLARSSFLALILVALPAFVVMRVGAQWTYGREGFSGHGDPRWIRIGRDIADGGLLLLLVTVGATYSWVRRAAAGRASWQPLAVSALGGVYLVLLVVAWLAMAGKWH